MSIFLIRTFKAHSRKDFTRLQVLDMYCNLRNYYTLGRRKVDRQPQFRSYPTYRQSSCHSLIPHEEEVEKSLTSMLITKKSRATLKPSTNHLSFLFHVIYYY